MADDLKSSPVFIAGSSVAATIGICVLIYKEVLLPTHTLSLQNQINAQNVENGALKAKIEPLERANASLKEQIGLLQARSRELEASNLFSAGTPYPVGLAAIRIGQPNTEIEKAYPVGRIDKTKDEGFWSVGVENSVIESITYYFASDKKIYQMLFHLRTQGKTSVEEDAKFLISKLTDSLGTPIANPKPGYAAWNCPDKVKAYIFNSRYYLIIEAATIPRGWPRS